jgi:hypothetical protein
MEENGTLLETFTSQTLWAAQAPRPMTFRCSLMRVVHKESLHCGVCRGISASALDLSDEVRGWMREKPDLWAIQIK